jgi:PKD repeat protein
VVEASAPTVFNNSVTETTIGPANQTAEIRATDITEVVEEDATNTSLGTVTVAANESANVSQAELTVSVSRIDDDRGTPINVTTQNGTVTVREQGPLAPGLNPPSDPDNDGVFEDVNGNGRVDFNDVVVLFENLPDAEAPFQDVNGNGRIDFDDIVELFQEIGNPSNDSGVQIQQTGDSVVASGTVEAGDSVAVDLSDLPAEKADENATVESVRIDYAESTSVNTTISTETALKKVPAPPDSSILRYLNVSHPETTDTAIEEATVRFVLERDRIGGNQSVDVLRYDRSDETWEATSAEPSFVESSTEGNVYEARLDELSLIAVVRTARSSIVAIPAAERPVNATLIGGESTYPSETYRTYRTKSLNSTWWNDRATRNADDAAAVIREELRLDLEQAAKDTAVSKLVAFADNSLQSLLHISGISKLLAARDILTKSSDFLVSFGPAIQQKAVAIHVDPATESPDKIQANLRQLEENTAAFKQADQNGNAERKQQLLKEREQLLRETYLLLPRYLTDVHSSVVGNAAGMEDPRAYSVIRTNVESLRMQLKLDYQWTTTGLENAPDTQLPRETSMPTHGWVAFGRATVYDTMDHSDDYVVLRLNATQAVQADEDVTVAVEGANVTGMETLVRSTRPDRPRTTTGRSFGANGDATIATTELTNPEETTYVIVRSSESEGPIRISATAPSTPVRFSVVERAGPDIQRPHADLITGPDPVTLRDGDVVYPTNSSETTLTWELWDDKTAIENIEYRIRVNRGSSGFTSWTAWQSAPESGQVSPALEYTDGITRVQLQVRDGVGRTAVRNADVVVSEGAPQTTVAAPDDPTSPEAYVRILPERRIERVELQYRRVGNQTWTDWKTVTDTRGFGQITVPIQGEVTVRARATGLDGATGEWDTDQVTYQPPPDTDTTSPTINLTDAPPQRLTRIDGTVQQRRVTQDASTTLRWNLTDDGTTAANVEYRVRVDNEAWSAWTATGDGVVSISVSLASNGTNVELAARDAAGNTATQALRLRRDTTEPTVQLNVTDDVTGAVVDPQVSEPVQRIELQYRAAGLQTWRDWSTVSDDSTTAVALDQTGQFEARARATDTAGNVGPWSDPALFNSLADNRGRTLLRPTDPFDPSGNDSGDQLEEEIPTDASTYINATRDTYLLYNTLVDEINGELLIDMYVVTRQGREIPISSIRLTEERNQTIKADLPNNLTAGSKLRVEVRGNGTVRLESLRAIGAQPSLPTIVTLQDPPEVGDPINLTAEGDWSGDSYIERYEWDRDGDGTFELTTTESQVNITYQTPGTRNVTVRVIDVFGAASVNNTTLQVNAPPDPELTVPSTVPVGERVSFNGSASTDIDDEIVAYDWYVNGDERSISGAIWNTTFTEPGTYDIRLTVRDTDGSTATVARDLTIVGPLNFSQVSSLQCSDFCQQENSTTLVVGGDPSAREIALRQDGEEYRVVALSNGQRIEQFYDYGNAKINSPLPIAKSDHSRLFFWDGPEGLSLVVLHDKGRDGSGAAVSFDFEGLYSNGSWVVKDDSGDFTNRTQADWAWNERKTDGGAFRGGLYDRQLTIDPRFNEAARSSPLSPGSIDTWEVLTGQATDPRALTLEMNESVTIEFPEQTPDSGSGGGGGGGLSTANWTYSTENRSSVPFELVYETEQTGDAPEVTFTITGATGTTEQKTLAIGTVGTRRKQLDLDQFDGPVEMSVRAQDVDIRIRIVPD